MSKENKQDCKVRFIDYEDGVFGLIFDDFSKKQEIFDELAVENTAYTWDDLVCNIVKERHANLLDNLHFDSESSMFVVRSSSEEDLEVVKKLIEELFQNEVLLSRSIKGLVL